MKSESSGEFSKWRWIFMYSIWIFAELTSVVAVVYSIYSVIILMYGNWAGASVFVGIFPGFVMSLASLHLWKLVRIPWRAGDFQTPSYDDPIQVRQVRLFHTILWNDKESGALPHGKVDLDHLEPKSKKDGFLVYPYQGYICYSYDRQEGRWRAYAWAVLCEVFVFAVISLSAWFMVWAGLEASISFLSGSLLSPSGLGAFFFYRSKGNPLASGSVFASGLTWVIVKDRGTLHLRHFMLHCLFERMDPCIVSEISRDKDKVRREQGASDEIIQIA
jgi:hypothetical protein